MTPKSPKEKKKKGRICCKTGENEGSSTSSPEGNTKCYVHSEGGSRTESSRQSKQTRPRTAQEPQHMKKPKEIEREGDRALQRVESWMGRYETCGLVVSGTPGPKGKVKKNGKVK